MNQSPQLSSRARERMKQYLGWSDAQIDNLSPKMVKFISQGELSRLREYKPKRSFIIRRRLSDSLYLSLGRR
jgi:hypothetical protein